MTVTPENNPGAAQEESYLKLLKGLSQASEHGAETLGVVRRIATWIESAAVLQVIGAQRRWIVDWPIKEALVQNPSTPEAVRSPLERQVAFIDLLRELDQGGFDKEERQEILEDARSLIASLPAEDRKAVRERAYELSSSRREMDVTGAISIHELPILPPEHLQEASEAPKPDPEETEAGTEEIPVSARARTDDDLTADELFAEDEVPPARRQPAEPELIIQPEPLDEDEEEDAEAEPAAEEPAEEEPAAEETTEEEPPPEEPAPTEKGQEESLEEDAPEPAPVEETARDPLSRASASSDPAELSRLAQDASEEVQLALVGNPQLPDPAAVMLARKAPYRVAEAIYRNRALFSRPPVRAALLECPNAPAAAQLQAVDHVGDFTSLVRLLGNPRVRHLEVKNKARSRLRGRFKALSQGEKAAAVRQGGRAMLRHLWTDFFRDEGLVLRCLKEKQLDDGTVLEIARSKIAPRRALEVIGSTPAWTSRYQVVLALVVNPKTPRQIAQRLLPRLKPADRKMVQRNPAIPESVRRMA